MLPSVNVLYHKIPGINLFQQYHSMLTLTRKLDALRGIMLAIVVLSGVL